MHCPEHARAQRREAARLARRRSTTNRRSLRSGPQPGPGQPDNHRITAQLIAAVAQQQEREQKLNQRHRRGLPRHRPALPLRSNRGSVGSAPSDVVRSGPKYERDTRFVAHADRRSALLPHAHRRPEAVAGRRVPAQAAGGSWKQPPRCGPRGCRIAEKQQPRRVLRMLRADRLNSSSVDPLGCSPTAAH
jgi:hypothetical protein